MGSACLFFALAPKRAKLNDNNSALVATYKAIKAVPEEVYDKFQSYPVTKRFFDKLRDRSTQESDPISAAADFLYLNRYCFNGL